MKNATIIAMAVHAINSAYCASMGDLSQPAWADAPKAHRDSILAGVKMHLANPQATPEDAHNAWATQKLAEGWTHGEVKDVDAKTHPALLPYDKLPPEQRAKDYIFRAAVHAIAAMPEPVQAEATQPGHTAVEYIHRDPDYVDRLYGSNLTFQPGQVRNIPDDMAQKFLRHEDLFRKADPVAAPDTETAAAIKDELTKKQALDQVQFEIQGLRDIVNALPTKATIVDWAKSQYQQELDSKAKIDDLRQHALSLIDRFGPKL